MRKKFIDLSPGQDYAIRIRPVANDGTYRDWSRVFNFTTDGDSIPPNPVTGLTWVPTGSSFLANWQRPATDSDGEELRDLKDYEVTITRGGTTRVFYVTNTSFELTLEMNYEIFGDVAYTVDISVKVRDLTFNKSTAVTATATNDTPPVPSTPVLATDRGQIVVTWNGNPASGVRNAININHVEIHASTSANFTPSESTLKGRFDGLFPGPQSRFLENLTYGTAYEVCLVSVNRLGRKSAASGRATATPQRLTGLDIQDGQISTAEINFTARDIGGANAYYPATTTAMNALTGVKNGDIAYITGSGYATYRYNGTSWVAAPEIGVVSGTKIIAGTVTSDAVGTNLLITSSANIGTAVIDAANIGSINANTITAGSLKSSSTVTYGGGAARPTWQFDLNGDGYLNNVSVRGQLVIGNSGDALAVRTASQVRSYDYIQNTAGWAIKGDGTVEFNNGTFRGSIIGASITGANLKTAETGRRIEILSSGNLGEINFYGGTANVRSSFRSYTEADGTTEALQFGMADGPNSLWNKINYNSQAWSTYMTNRHDFIYGTSFTLYEADAGTGANARTAFSAGSGGFYFEYLNTDSFTIYERNTSNNIQTGRLIIEASGEVNFYRSPGGDFNVWERAPGGVSIDPRFRVTDDNVWFQWPTTDARMVIMPSSGGGISPILQLVSDLNYGGTIFHRTASGGTSPRFEFRDVTSAANTYQPLWAGSFVVNSSEAGKKAVTPYNDDAMAEVRGIDPVTFRRRAGRGASGGPEEFGVIAEKMPRSVQVFNDDGTIYGVDLQAEITLAFAAIKSVDGRMSKAEDALPKVLARLEKIERALKGDKK